METKDKEDFISHLKKNVFKEKNAYKYFFVSTKEYDLTVNPRNRLNKARCEWADNTVRELFKKERKDISRKKPRIFSTGEYNFVYIKFVKEKANEKTIIPIVNGLSCFHAKYPSDVWFYDISNSKKKKLKNFIKDKYEWYTDEILIIIGNYPEIREEAKEIEKTLHNKLNLYD